MPMCCVPANSRFLFWTNVNLYVFFGGGKHQRVRSFGSGPQPSCNLVFCSIKMSLFSKHLI